jgi:hypothetical protein
MSSNPESHSTLSRNLLAAGVAASVLLTASCSELPGGKSDQAHTLEFEGDAPTDAFISDIEHATELMRSGYLPDDAEKQVAAIADPEFKGYAQKYLDFMRADDVNSFDDPEEKSRKVEQITDSGVKNLVQKRIDINAALDLSDAWLDIAEARTSIATIVDPETKKQAQKLYDLSIAEHAKASSTVQAEVIAAIDSIQDPAIKAWAVRSYDYELADKAMNEYFAEDETKAALDAITNPDVKDAAQANYRNAIGYAAKNDLTSKKYDEPDLEVDSYDITSALRSSEHDINSILDAQQLALRKAFNAANREALTKKAAEIVVPGEYKPQAFKPKELVAPQVRLSDEQKSDISESEYSELGESDKDVNFAELSVGEDGELQFLFPEGSALDAKTQKQLELQFSNLKPFITAAFNNGSLSRIRFAIGSYNPYYDSLTREIVIQIPQGEDSDVTMDQLASGLLHETVHALTSGKSNGETLTKDEFTQFGEVCAAAGKQARDKFEVMAYGLDADFAALKKYLPKEQQPVVDFVAAAVDNGTLDELIFKNTTYTENSGLPFHCEVPDLFGLFYDASYQMGISLEFTEGYLEDDSIIKLYNQWDETVRYLSLYSKINESNFAKTDSEIKPYLGHSEDNASELLASFVDSATYYKTELADVVKSMDAESQLTIVTLLRRSVDMISADNPELAGVMATVEADFLTELHAQ